MKSISRELLEFCRSMGRTDTLGGIDLGGGALKFDTIVFNEEWRILCLNYFHRHMDIASTFRGTLLGLCHELFS